MKTDCAPPPDEDFIHTVAVLPGVPSFNGIVAGKFNSENSPYPGFAVTGTNIFDETGRVYIYLGNGDNTFGNNSPGAYDYAYTVGNNPIGIAKGKFTSSHHNDLVIANSDDSSISILLGNGQGEFLPFEEYGVSSGHPISVAVGDFNGDGIHDIATVSLTPNGEGNFADIFLGYGDGHFTHIPSLFIGNSGSSGTNPGIAVGKFNNNHRFRSSLAIPDELSHAFYRRLDDLAVTTGDNVKLLLSNGDGTFSPIPLVYTTGQLPVSIAAGDLNGDGFQDLVVGNQGNNTVSIFLQNVNATPGRRCNLEGITQKQVVGGRVVFINKITWDLGPNIAGLPVTHYIVYEDGVPVKTIPATASLQYVDYNVPAGVPITYTITSYNALNQSSAPCSLTLTPPSCK